MRTLQIPAQRQQMILDYIRKQEGANIKELASYLEVSEATVRRDLDNLAEAGEIERTHGGAVQPQEKIIEYTYDTKMELRREEKTRIAKEVAKMVKDGDNVYLGSAAALIVFIPSIILGLIFSDYALFVALGVGGITYYILMKFWILKKYPQDDIE